jgi:hypothetical protein
MSHSGHNYNRRRLYSWSRNLKLKGLRGSGPGGACSITDRKVIKRTTSKFHRREHRIYIEEGLEDLEAERTA